MGGGVPGMTTWFYRGVGQMTMFDHDGGRGGQNFQKSDHVVYGCPQNTNSKILIWILCKDLTKVSSQFRVLLFHLLQNEGILN